MSYDFYVWVCYAIAAMVLGVICLVSFYDMVKQKKILSKYEGRTE